MCVCVCVYVEGWDEVWGKGKGCDVSVVRSVCVCGGRGGG